MNGAREYAKLFKTGQIGRLYIVSGSHARGSTFQIFVLPEGEDGKSNGPNNSPLNSGAVEVYGMVDGQRGWTESYGWIHSGRWEQDFYEIVANRKAEIANKEAIAKRIAAETEADRKAKVVSLLATY